MPDSEPRPAARERRRISVSSRATSDPNGNACWARALVEELARAGCHLVVLCPGNRNLPLLWACHAETSLSCVVHPEERSAAFLALGHIRADGRPAVVVTTSGSAVANCLPAICEAAQAGLPLIILSADRPSRLHDRLAPQTMPQLGLFGAFAPSIALPEPDRDRLPELRLAVSRAVLHAASTRAPLHLNAPFDDPLAPLPDPTWVAGGLSDLAAIGRWSADGPLPAAESEDPLPPQLPDLSALAGRGRRGLLVVGPDPCLPPRAIAALAEALGWPLLADAASGLRRPAPPGLICHADLLSRGCLGDERPDVIVRLGLAPVTRGLQTWLQHQSCPVLRLDRHAIHGDWLHPQALLAHGLRGAELRRLAEMLRPADPAWRRAWLEADARISQRLDEALNELPWGEDRAAARVCRASGFSTLWLSNSLPVRHAERWLRASPEPGPAVLASRGVNGIDGQLATALGVGRASQAPVLALLGDLACLHDLPALAAHDRCGRGVLVILDNNGGGIFDQLPASRLPGYRDLVRAPQHFDPLAAAQAFGLSAARANNDSELSAALVPPEQGWRLLHVPVPPCSALNGGKLLLLRALG